MADAVKNKRIFLSSPHMSDEGYEMQYIKEAFDTNWIAPLGNNVNMFEKECAAKLSAKECVALSSGTAAIHLALKSAGVTNGDVVFCPTLTFSATANPIIYCNAVPVFIDSDYQTWNMSYKALKKAFQKYLKANIKPKAVIVAHLYGISASLKEIVELCKEYEVPLIEDAAESFGTLYDNKFTGTFGDYGILSFNGNKIITTSGGGMLICNNNDAELKAAKARFWATQSRENALWYQHKELGYNYRMSNIVAGIGRGQLKVLDDRINKKRYIYSVYEKELTSLKGFSLMPLKANERSNCWLTAVRINKDTEIKPADIIKELEKENIESRYIWKPLHLQPFFAGRDFINDDGKKNKVMDEYTGADDSVAGTIFAEGLCLPSDTKMTDEDILRVCSIIKRLW